MRDKLTFSELNSWLQKNRSDNQYPELYLIGYDFSIIADFDSDQMLEYYNIFIYKNHVESHDELFYKISFVYPKYNIDKQIISIAFEIYDRDNDGDKKKIDTIWYNLSDYVPEIERFYSCTNGEYSLSQALRVIINGEIKSTASKS